MAETCRIALPRAYAAIFRPAGAEASITYRWPVHHEVLREPRRFGSAIVHHKLG